MKNLIVLFLCILVSGLDAQTCDDIKDIHHKNNCQYAHHSCDSCNYPNQRMIASWDMGRVIEFTTSEQNCFIRFYYQSASRNNKVGRWLVKESDLHEPGTAMPDMQEIREILCLAHEPNRCTIVTIPPGVTMLEGLIMGSTKRHCRQFCIEDDKVEAVWFGGDGCE
jgi:hypothetical protein